MAWEKRKRGGLYYTRSKRVNGRVEREYIGTGRVAEIHAEIDRMEKERKDEERRQIREMIERLRRMESSILEIVRPVEILVRSAFHMAGFHQHKRGEWRKKRVKKAD